MRHRASTSPSQMAASRDPDGFCANWITGTRISLRGKTEQTLGPSAAIFSGILIERGRGAAPQAA